MCLDIKRTDIQREKWLKKQPEMIIAYKVIWIQHPYTGPSKFFPQYFINPNKPFKRKNRLRKRGTKVKCDRSKGEYIPYYHLYASRISAERWKDSYHTKVIKCRIPKKLVTDVGSEVGYSVIVTRGFDIVGEDRYLD